MGNIEFWVGSEHSSNGQGGILYINPTVLHVNHEIEDK